MLIYLAFLNKDYMQSILFVSMRYIKINLQQLSYVSAIYIFINFYKFSFNVSKKNNRGRKKGLFPYLYQENASPLVYSCEMSRGNADKNNKLMQISILSIFV